MEGEVDVVGDGDGKALLVRREHHLVRLFRLQILHNIHKKIQKK
jgi:hypothetical protein